MKKILLILLITIISLLFFGCFFDRNSTPITSTYNVWNFLGAQNFSGELAFFPSIAVDSQNRVYVVYGGPNGAIVMYYDNPYGPSQSWQILGNQNFSNGEVSFSSTAIDSHNRIYVAYEGFNGATVMYYDNPYDPSQSWQILGNQNFSNGEVSFSSTAIDSHNRIYVAYRDDSTDGKGGTTVMYYDNPYDPSQSWQILGKQNFSDGEIHYTSIAVDSNNRIYIAYISLFNNNESLNVMYYDNPYDSSQSWQPLGNKGFVTGLMSYPSIVIDGNNRVYVAYLDCNSDKEGTTVMYYDGSSWQPLGKPCLSSGTYPSIAIDSNNRIYVAFANDYGGNPVMYYDGSSWQPLGNQVFDPGLIEFPSIATDSNNRVYVAYTDWHSNEKSASVMYYQN